MSEPFEPEEGGRLARALDASAPPGPGEADGAAMLAAVKGEIATPGALGRLRALSTRARIAIAIGMAAFVGSGYAVMRPRGDLEGLGVARIALAMLVLLGGAAFTIGAALRPVHRPAWSSRKSLLLVLAAVLAPLLIALLPHAHASPEPDLTASAMRCCSLGSMIVMPLLALLWALGRGGPATGGGMVMAAAACGLTANLVLEMHCAATDPLHLVLGHASVGALYVAAAYALSRVLGRR